MTRAKLTLTLRSNSTGPLIELSIVVKRSISLTKIIILLKFSSWKMNIPKNIRIAPCYIKLVFDLDEAVLALRYIICSTIVE